MLATTTQTFVAGAVLLLACAQLTQALYFHIGETERKCFIEEVPDETTVIGEYLCPSRCRQPKRGCLLC